MGVVAETMPVETIAGVQVPWPDAVVETHVHSMPVLLGHVHPDQRKKQKAHDVTSKAAAQVPLRATTRTEVENLSRSERGRFVLDSGRFVLDSALPASTHVIPRLTHARE